MSTTINNTIACNEPHASLDSYYGPYKSVAEACRNLTTVTVLGNEYTMRHIGLTVGIIDATTNKIVEYWFNGGTDDEDLVEKVTSSGSGLPEGIKVVTFDKNGGSGVQNTLLTDIDGYVVMPIHSVTRSGYNFTGWKLGATTYQEGVEVHVTDNANFVAQWEQEVTYYTIRWNDSGTNATITSNVANNSQHPSGTPITLTATLNTGYTFVQWTGLSGDLTNNPISFNLTADTIGISVQTKQDETTYKVEFTYDNGVESIKALYQAPGEEERDFTSGTKLPINSIVTLTPTYKEGFSYSVWMDAPEEGCVIDDKGVLKINNLNKPINVKLITNK